MRILQLISLILLTGLSTVPATAQPASEEDGRSLLRFWRAACYQGNTDSCLALTRILRNAPDEATGLSEARHLSQASCNAGIQQGCVLLGEMYLHGRGMDQDKPRATDLFETACEQGEGFGCYQLAQIVRTEASDAQDMVTLLERACTLKDPDGCADLAQYHDSPVALSGGEYISKEENPVAAAAYFRQSCAYARFPTRPGENPCYSALARSLTAPDAGPDGLAPVLLWFPEITDESEQSIAERGCNLGEWLSCIALAEHSRDNPKRAFFWYRRGCFWNSAEACANYMLIDAEPPDVPRDDEGLTATHRTRMVSMLPYARGRCEKADRNCFMLGAFFEFGVGVSQSYTEAQKLYQRSCEAVRRPDGRACVSLAFLVQSGKGSEPDQARAFVYLRRADEP